ncbi:MAG: hypothetical protein WC449_05805 [Candidatus Paceibacterota bacterium]
MKLTKSYNEKRLEKQRFNKKWFGKRKKVFLWLPTRMNDGSTAWLQYAWLDYGIERDYDKINLLSGHVSYYYEGLE